jgi:hypothetical protein
VQHSDADRELISYRSSKEISKGEARITVDLDAGKPNRKLVADRGVHYIRIRQSKVVKLTCLSEYLNGTCSWDTRVLEGMSKG